MIRNAIIFLAVIFFLFSKAIAKSEIKMAEGGKWGIEWTTPINFHAILIADTNDHTIGKAALVSLKKTETFLDNVSKKLFVNYNKLVISGTDFDNSNILEIVENMDISNLDTVFLFYFGHGENNNTSSQLPTISNTDGISISVIIDSILNKNPRLLISLSDACNAKTKNVTNSAQPEIAEIVVPKISNYPTPEMANSYSRLFLESAGSIILSSAMKDQLAYYSDEVGGLYTDIILKSLSEMSRHYRASWILLRQFMSQEIVYTNIFDGSKIEQRPVTLVNVIDLYAPMSMFNMSKGDDNFECWEVITTGELGNPEFNRCFSEMYGLHSPVIFEHMGNLPNILLPGISQNVVDNFFRTVSPETRQYELIGIAKRYQHGEGEIARSYERALELMEEAHKLGNNEAAGIIGDEEMKRFEQTEDLHALINAIEWYRRGGDGGDERSLINWAQHNAWYGTDPQKIRKSIPILQKYKDPEASNNTYLIDLCDRGFAEACQ